MIKPMNKIIITSFFCNSAGRHVFVKSVNGLIFTRFTYEMSNDWHVRASEHSFSNALSTGRRQLQHVCFHYFLCNLAEPLFNNIILRLSLHNRFRCAVTFNAHVCTRHQFVTSMSVSPVIFLIISSLSTVSFNFLSKNL